MSWADFLGWLKQKEVSPLSLQLLKTESKYILIHLFTYPWQQRPMTITIIIFHFYPTDEDHSVMTRPDSVDIKRVNMMNILLGSLLVLYGSCALM